MRVLGISGSPRTGGNCERLLRVAFDVFEAAGMETDLLSVADHAVQPCIACGGCVEAKTGQCIQEDPAFDGIIERFREADAILVASPVYFGSATPQVMSILDRVGYVARFNGNFLSRKVGASIVVARRAGQNFTFAQLNFFFLINDMVVPGSTYWNIAFGREMGEVDQDAEGLATVQRLAENMTWLTKKLAS